MSGSINSTRLAVELELGAFRISESVKHWRAQDGRRPMVILALLARHESGDWGELTAQQHETNTAALYFSGAVTSTCTIDGARIQVTTAADRSTTTITATPPA